MAYRKIKADKIFTGSQLLQNQVLVIAGNGTVIDLISDQEAGSDLEIMEGWLCPGFINAHCHLELSHMKGLVPAHTGMTDFLLAVLFQRQAPAEKKQQAIQEALQAMQKNGIVGLGDICNTADSIAAKAALPAFHCHNFIELSGFVPATAGTRLAQGLELMQQFSAVLPAEKSSITPHASYSVSDKLFAQIGHQSPAIVSIHNQESAAEEEFIRHKTGELLRLFTAIGVNIDFFEAGNQSSLAHTLPQLPAAAQWILVHNCHTTKEDISLLKAHLARHSNACYFCVCPNANLYIGNPLPDMQALYHSDIPICMGTDSLTNNASLSILAEMQTLQAHFPWLPVETVLQWATLNGARALKMEQQLGSFEKGKQPGILLLQGSNEQQGLLNAKVQPIA